MDLGLFNTQHSICSPGATDLKMRYLESYWADLNQTSTCFQPSLGVSWAALLAKSSYYTSCVLVAKKKKKFFQFLLKNHENSCSPGATDTKKNLKMNEKTRNSENTS